MKTFLLMFWLLMPAAHAADFGQIYREAVTAWQNRDYVGMAEQARLGLEMRPDYPLMNFLLAMAMAGDGEDEQALQILGEINALRIRVAALDAENFPTLIDDPEFMHLAEDSAALDGQVVGEATVAFNIPQHDFLAESLARDEKGERWLVGGVHRGMIVAVSDDGGQSLFAQGGLLGGPLSMAIDPQRGLLWVASGVLPEMRANPDAIRGVLAFDLASGKLQRSALLPLPDANPGDLLVSPAGDLYVSDGINGVVYRMRAGEAELTPIVSGLNSPQGIAIDDSGKLWIADYRGGLIAAGREQDGWHSRKLYPLAGNSSLYGIDGLVFAEGRLIAIQNGITPHRIVSIELDNGTLSDVSILGMNLPGFDEPTLGKWHDGSFYFIANSQWGKFADPGNPPGPGDADPPSIMRIEPRGN